VRAMILAAGLGTRMRPLTEETPKPLLPVANRPLLEYTLALLSGAPVDEVMINTHHLAEVMESGLRDLDTAGLRVHFSREREILGTAGGPRKASPFLEGGAFFLLNGDFLIEADLGKVLDLHRASNARATMVLRPDESGEIYLDPSGRIRQFLEPRRSPSPEWTRCGFTGIHVLEPEVLELIPRRVPWEINRQVYPEMLRRGWKVCGCLHRGYWREAGEPAGYLEANLEALAPLAGRDEPRAGQGHLPPTGKGISPPVLLGPGSAIDEGVLLGPGVVVGPGARVGKGSVLSRTVILEGTEVPESTSADGAILFPGGRLAIKSR